MILLTLYIISGIIGMVAFQLSADPPDAHDPIKILRSFLMGFVFVGIMSLFLSFVLISIILNTLKRIL